MTDCDYVAFSRLIDNRPIERSIERSGDGVRFNHSNIKRMDFDSSTIAKEVPTMMWGGLERDREVAMATSRGVSGSNWSNKPKDPNKTNGIGLSSWFILRQPNQTNYYWFGFGFMIF